MGVFWEPSGEGLMTSDRPFPEGKRVDPTVAYDTVVVAWVLYCAFYCFWLGRALGVASWPGRPDA